MFVLPAARVTGRGHAVPHFLSAVSRIPSLGANAVPLPPSPPTLTKICWDDTSAVGTPSFRSVCMSVLHKQHHLRSSTDRRVERMSWSHPLQRGIAYHLHRQSIAAYSDIYLALFLTPALDTSNTIEVHLFLSEVFKFGTFRPLLKTDLENNENLFRIKQNPKIVNLNGEKHPNKNIVQSVPMILG